MKAEGNLQITLTRVDSLTFAYVDLALPDFTISLGTDAVVRAGSIHARHVGFIAEVEVF